MTYYYTPKTYEVSALSSADTGGHVKAGSSFKMPAYASVCLTIKDDDAFLSGDTCYNDHSDDKYYQSAKIEQNGHEVGNGGQIYAESYWWVYDQYGNWYVMVEIEQEGSGNDYYTFYNGGGYSTPPADAHLTVYGACDVKGDWLDYKCLGAGEKEEPGPTWDFDEETCTYTVQAEDLDLHNFKVVSGSKAEGGELVKITAHEGKISTEFGGSDGVYNLTVCVQDECDGISKLKVYVNGEYQDTILLDQQSNGGGSDNGYFTAFTLNGLEIAEGDKVEIRAWNDGGEFVRIDALKFEQVKFEVCDDPDAVKIDFESFAAADVLTSIDGVTISATGGSGDAMIFDSQNPTGGDGDLETQVAQLGNILIVSEDGDSSDPDDAIGGTLTFDFDLPATVFDLKVVDTEEGGTITLTLDDGSTQTFDIPNLVNGGVGQVVMNVDNVVSMEVALNGSGAIDDLCYVPGVEQLGSIAGRYFCDENDNDRDDGEPGVAGATVWLIEDGVGVVDTTTTDADGNYLFSDVPAGQYSVQFEAPDDVAGSEGKVYVAPDVGDPIDDSDVISTDGDGNGSTMVFTLAAGENKKNVDAGIEDPDTASIAGRVFCDENDNSLDDGEPGVGGVLVRLLATDGTELAITTTLADGSYEFTGLAAGDYKVQFPLVVDGKVLVDPNVGSDDTIDSDAGDNGETAVISLEIGERSEDNDAGIEDPATGSLSGRYFCDENRDNLDNGEPGIAGVVVTLLDAAGNSTGLTTVTDADGNYSFGSLLAGTYGVSFTDPSGVIGAKELVTANVGADDAIDSDAIGDTTLSTISDITVNIGQNTPDNDAGAAELLGSLSGRYFCDENDNDVDDGEPGIEGVLVTLLDAAGNPTGRTTTTDSSGNYSFTGLVAGTYGVLFTDPNGVLAGKELVADNVGGDDSIDSDAIGDTTSSTIVNIAVLPGQDTPDNDAGAEVPNEDPTATDDMGKGCADEEITVDFSDNYADVDSASVGITMIDGVAISAGETVELSDGAFVTLTAADEFIFDGEDAYAALDIGEEATTSYEVKVEDSDGGVATASIDVTYCGDANTLESLCDSLTGLTGFMQIIDENNPTPSSDEVWTLKITGTGDARLDGLVIDEAYCIAAYEDVIAGNFGTDIDLAPLLEVDIYCADDLPAGVLTGVGRNGVAAQDNLDLISWILNQDFNSQGYTDGEIQGAIWGLTDDTFFVAEGAGQRADAREIYEAALANGEGFVAGPGGVVTLVLDPTEAANALGHDQPYIIGIDFEDLDCIC